jgi:adenylate cyclase
VNIYCLDKNNKLKVFKYSGNSKIMKLALINKGYTIVEDEEQIKQLLEVTK